MGERKPEAEVVEMAVQPIIEAAEFEAVQTALTAPRVVSGPTLLTGIWFLLYLLTAAFGTKRTSQRSGNVRFWG